MFISGISVLFGKFVICEGLLLKEDFEAGQLSSLWRLQVGGNVSFVRLERGEDGRCLNLLGDHSANQLASYKSIPTLRENAEIFISGDVKPALPKLSPPLFTNRFREGEHAIHTIYNAGLWTHFSKQFIPIPKDGHIFDLLNLREVRFRKEGKIAVVDVSVDPHDVLCLLVTTKIIELKVVEGKKLSLRLKNDKIRDAELRIARIDEEGVRRDIKCF